MKYWIRKLAKEGKYYRVNLPKELVKEAGFEGCEMVRLTKDRFGAIRIEEYHGRTDSAGEVPGDRSNSD